MQDIDLEEVFEEPSIFDWETNDNNDNDPINMDDHFPPASLTTTTTTTNPPTNTKKLKAKVINKKEVKTSIGGLVNEKVKPVKDVKEATQFKWIPRKLILLVQEAYCNGNYEVYKIIIYIYII